MAEKKKRVQIIPPIHGKVTRDGKVSEPDIYWIMEKWLARHPQVNHEEHSIRVTRGEWTTHDGFKTEVLMASIVDGDHIAGYAPEDDVDLYEYYLAEDRYHQLW